MYYWSVSELFLKHGFIGFQNFEKFFLINAKMICQIKCLKNILAYALNASLDLFQTRIHRLYYVCLEVIKDTFIHLVAMVSYFKNWV